MKLARQQHDREERQQHHSQKVADRGDIFDRPYRLRCLHGALDQLFGREHPEGDEGAGREEGHELDDRLGCNREHEAVLVLRRVGLTRAEQHREHGHRERDHERDIADDRNMRESLVFGQDRLQRRCHRLELQRDVGNRSDYCDQGNRRGDSLTFSVARPDEVGNRGDVLRFGEMDDPAQQRRAEPDHQDRADVNREEVDIGSCGEADRAEERPGCAIDRQ
jgi:hypothetical protein